MRNLKPLLCTVMASLMATPSITFGASHREAPITALDRTADITDFFAFVSYDDPTKVTIILNVDPLLEPGNGPNYFPFDDNVLYQIHVDNNNTATDGVVFNFQFTTEIRAPQVFTGFVGAGAGINAPANSPAPVAPGTPIVPPAITALDGAGSAGLSLRQHYSVSMTKGGATTQLTNANGQPLFAVPSNVGPRTMPNYPALAAQGIYSLGSGIRVFAGTVDDPFYIDLGAAFDSLNFRSQAGGGVLSAAQDADDNVNTAPDTVSGYNVNTIAIEVPISSADQHWYDAEGHRHRRRARLLGHHIPAAHYGSPLAATCRAIGLLLADSAHGKSSDQRTHHRHGFQGFLEHEQAVK